MEKIERIDLNITIACSFQQPPEFPPEECRLIWGVAKLSLNPGNILLYRDLRVQHVWLCKKDRTCRFQNTVNTAERFFDFQLYSDETGMSKPNEKMFRLMLENVATVRNDTAIPLSNIIHIGDNVKADINGAQVTGIRTLLVNSNNQCISSLLN